MKPIQTGIIAVVVAAIGAGAVGRYYLSNAEGCLTRACRAADERTQRESLDAADAQVGIAWADLQHVANQRIQIATQIGGAGQETLNARDARLRAGISRQEFLMSGLDFGSLAGFGRPLLQQAFVLKNERKQLATRYANATRLVRDASARARLAIQPGLVAHSARDAAQFAGTVDQLGEACAAALHALVEEDFVSRPRAGELAGLLATNETSLHDAWTTYSVAVTRSARLRNSAAVSLTAGRVAFGNVDRDRSAQSGAIQRELAALSASKGGELAKRSVASDERVEPLSSPGRLITDRSRLGAKQDIARLNAQSQALEQQARETLDSIPASTSPADNMI